MLIDYLGGFAPVNALIDSMNQRETVLARKMLDTEAAMRGEENFTSADDVVSLLGAVWDGDVLSRAVPRADDPLHAGADHQHEDPGRAAARRAGRAQDRRAARRLARRRLLPDPRYRRSRWRS